MNTEFIASISDMGQAKLDTVFRCLAEAPRGVFLEVGNRYGGTLLAAIETPNCELAIGVDPYGDKLFMDQNGASELKFGEEMYHSTLKHCGFAAVERNIVFAHYRMTSNDYMNAEFSLWAKGKELIKDNIRYSYVLLDGAHEDAIVEKEIEWFSKRMVPGGILLVDNIDWLTLNFDEWQQPRFDMAYKIF